MRFVRTRPLLVALVLVAAGDARADDTDALLGRWVGNVTLDDKIRPIAVTLQIDAVAIGEPAGTLRFGIPRACQVELEYSGPVKTQAVFSVKRSSGGYCDQLDSGVVTLQAGVQSVQFATMTVDEQPLESGTLRRPRS